MGGDLLADYRRKNIGFWNHFGMIFGIKKHHRIFLWHKNPTQSYFINLILLLANEFLFRLRDRLKEHYDALGQESIVEQALKETKQLKLEV